MSWRIAVIGVSRSTVAAFALLAGFRISATSQDVRQRSIPDQVACADCRIVVRDAATLAQGNGAPDLVRPPGAMVVDSRGFMTAAMGRFGPIVYDSQGGFVATVGRRGAGPGEYGTADLVTLAERDTVLIVDRSLQRLTVLSPDWKYVRSAPIPDAAFAMAWSRSAGRILMSAQVHDPARFGKPLHLFDGVGNYLRSFGEDGEPIIPGRTAPLARLVTGARGRGFWSSTVLGRYVVQLWSEGGALVESFRRDADWFPSTDTPQYGFTRSELPSAQVLSIAEDESGLLWTVVRVVDPNWRAALRWDNQARGEKALMPVIAEPRMAFDVVIEVIDPGAGRVVTRARFDHPWAILVAPDRLLWVHERPDGESDVRVQRIALEMSRGR